MQNSKSQADNNSPIEPQKPIETTSAQLEQNPMLAAGLAYGINMPVDKAQDAAVCDGRKIRHRLFDEHEYIFLVRREMVHRRWFCFAY